MATTVPSVVGQPIGCWRCYATLVALEGELLPEHQDALRGGRCPCSGTPFPRCQEVIHIPTVWTAPETNVSGGVVDPGTVSHSAGWVGTMIGYTPDSVDPDLMRVNCSVSYITVDLPEPKCECPRHKPAKYGIPEES